MFFGKSLRLFRIGGITISIDYSWFIIFGLLVFLVGTQILPILAKGATTGWYWGMAVLTALLFFASVVGHELSHAVVARAFGIPVNNITLFIFGGMAQMEDEPQRPHHELLMAIAGPIASVVIAIGFYAAFVISARAEAPLWAAAFSYLWFINLLLAVFNMLPGFPMDGGRVFRSIIWWITGNLRKSTLIASVVGQVFGWFFIAVGVLSLILPAFGGANLIWFALIGWFLVSAARGSYQQLVLRDTLSHVPVREVMNPSVESVPPDISVDHLVTEYFLRESASTLPVEQNGQLLGLVSIEDVRNAPREQWAHLLVREIMKPLAEQQIVHPENDAWDAANRMAQSNGDRVIVTDNGHVEGVVTRSAIMRWLQTHTGLAMGQA